MLFALAASLMAQKVPTRAVALQMTAPQALLRAADVGHKNPTDKLHISVSMPFGDPAGAQQFADSVSNPKSPLYRQFATPEQIGQRFGISDTNVQKIRSYLESQGLTIKLVGKNRLSMIVEGTVAQAEKTFGVTIDNYRTTATKTEASESFYSYATPPMMPAELAPFVIDVSGLENYTRFKPRYITPTQVRNIYNLKPMYDAGSHGEGRNIAISSWDGFRLSGVAGFLSWAGLPAPAGGAASNVTVKTTDGGSGANTPGGEADLDICTILGVAPLCNLYIYDGKGSSGPIPTLTLEANDNIADVISESYGWRFGSQSTGLACHNLHVSMSGQGITYMAASGDDGTSVSSFPYPNYDPEVLMVGGTTAHTDTDGNRTTETGWSGSGGGWFPSTDSFNTLPSWLAGPGIPTNIPFRIFPDVALNADPNTGYVVAWKGGLFVIGGTSGASPTYAGGLGVSEQKLIALGKLPANGAGKQRFGRIQDLLYSFQGDSSIFFDVTSGGNGNLPNGNPSNATTGWDMVTGWGAFKFNGFVNKLNNALKVVSLTSDKTTAIGASGDIITFTVTLDNNAGSGGQLLTLSSSDPSVTVPPNMTVAAGSSTGQFTATTNDVSATTSATIKAAGGSNFATATVSVTPGPQISKIGLSPTIVLGGSSTTVTGTVTLATAAPTGGMHVGLVSDDTSAANVPVNVLVLAGQKTATFTVTHNAVGTLKTPKISATSGGVTVSANLTVKAPVLSNLTLTPKGAAGGVPVTGTVSLSAPAPLGGLSVAISTSNSAAADLSTNSVFVAEGATKGTFTVIAKAVDAATSLDVTATLGAVSKTATLNVKVPVVASVVSSAPSVIGGGSVTLTVTLSGPAGPSGLNVVLAASPATAGTFVNTTIAVPAGSTSVTGTFQSKAVNADVAVSLSAKINSVGKSATLTVLAAKALSVSFNPSTVQGGHDVSITVTLDGMAGSLGSVVKLVSTQPTVMAVPDSVTVKKGTNSITFTATPRVVTSTKTLTVRATLGRNVESKLTITP